MPLLFRMGSQSSPFKNFVFSWRNPRDEPGKHGVGAVRGAGKGLEEQREPVW